MCCVWLCSLFVDCVVVVGCSLFIVSCLVFAVWCVVMVVCCLLFEVRCVLFVVCCLWCGVRCVLFVVFFFLRPSIVVCCC